ncbi:RNA-directed DNA polymerase, eukaryota, partial [Tanacetum coccineum]
KGNIADVFIAKHKNKLGQMFGFCRYNGIDNTQNLIDSLNGVWIGKLRLHANIAGFDRKEGFRPPQANVKKPAPVASTSIKRGANSSHSFVNVVKGVSNEEKMGTGGAPVDDSFSGVEIKYLGGLWVLFVFNDKHVSDKFLNHEGIQSWFSSLEPCWTPNFAPEAVDTEEEGYVADGVNVVEEGYVENFSNTDGGNVDEEEKELMGELFCTHDNGTPHNKKENTDAQPFNSDPFDQSDGGEKQHDFSDVNKPEFSVHHESKSIQSSQVKDDEAPRKYVGVSMIQQVEDTIKVGIALGFNMDGCQDMLQKMIADMGEDIVWGNTHFDFASTSARGRSGGILCIWNNLMFQKDSIICADNYVAVQVMGDFNEVREAVERSGTDFNERQAEIFNSFITNMNLFDVPLGGFRSTWTDKWASKMSKLDRFLATEGFHDVFPNITGNILEKGIPDHRPILLKESVVDYGPTLFRFFHSWLDCEWFYDLVVDTWKSYDSADSNGMISFKKKLQNLKQVIRTWSSSKKLSDNQMKKEHQNCLSLIDAKVDQGTATSDDLNLRISSMKILSDIDRKEASELAQKAKVKWALEGDENTSFFHGSLKKKRRESASRPTIGDVDFKQIFVEKREFLECDVSNEEIKRAVWDCGSDRAPGPDDWYRKRNKALMVFKVDFEKAFDSLRWDYLNVIMEKLGFGFKWRMWISGCLKNSRASILINGSPTSEFDMFNGRRQGDPMSSFLFILAMEGLHVLVSKAVTTGLYKGASIGRGVNVLDEEVSSMALVLGCRVAKLPMMYLGVPIGFNMRRCVNWKRVVQNFESMMNRWKAKLLSVGGRLSLIKVVLGNLPTYYMSLYWMPITVQKRLESMRNRFFIGGDSDDIKITWVKWNSCLAGKAMGGLVSHLQAKGIDLFTLCGRSVGDGNSTSFWGDNWCGTRPLKDFFPRVYALDENKLCTVAQRINIEDWSFVLRRPPRGGAQSNQLDELIQVTRDVVLSDSTDGWNWELDTTGYSVASACMHIDEHTLNGTFTSTRWLRCIPIKVNIFIWRLRLDKLPTLVNMDRKGIDIDSLICPICNEHVENVDHLFFSCEMAHDLWGLLARWCTLDIPEVSNITEWFSWLNDAHVSKSARIILEGIASTIMWSVWNLRNAWIFSSSKPKKANIWDSIVHYSFLWISSRNPNSRFRWIDWLGNPIDTNPSM